MKVNNFFIISIIVWTCFSYSVQAQDGEDPAIYLHKEDNGFITYELTNVKEDTYVFTLYGDGTFGTLNNPAHSFAPNNNGYDTESYFARAYDPNLPSVITKQTGPIGPINNAAVAPPPNPQIQMTGNIDLMTSWATAFDYENFYIIAFQNTTSQNAVSGTIELHYNEADIVVDTTRIKVYNNWVSSPPASSGSGNTNYTEKLEWNFSGLAQHETRFVYVPALTTKHLGENINLEVRLKINGVEKAETNTRTFLSRKYPHDPNFKRVNKTCTKPELSAQQELIYTVGFFNDGEYFARDVFVEDDLPENLDSQSITLLDYEVAPTWSEKNGKLNLDYIYINLPGTNQTSPKTYSYDDAFTHFSFKICTKANLTNCILNTASIIFDSQPVFYTNTSKICIRQDCMDFDICGENSLQKSQTTQPETTEPLEFTVFPNPAMNALNIDINFKTQKASDCNVALLDFSGKVIKEFKIQEQNSSIFTKTIDLKGVSSGLYFITLKTNTGYYTKKIIKN